MKGVIVERSDNEYNAIIVEIRTTRGEMSGIEVSTDETCKVVILSGDDETAEFFSATRDNTKLNEGICNGILKTGGTSDEGMGISTEIGVTDSSRQVAV